MNRKHIITLTAGAGILAGSLGLFTGVAVSPSDTKVRTVETEVEVEVTPDACVEALDQAEAAMDGLVEMLETSLVVVDAAVSDDPVAMLEAANAMGVQVDAWSPVLEAYAAAATACDGSPRGENGGLSL